VRASPLLCIACVGTATGATAGTWIQKFLEIRNMVHAFRGYVVYGPAKKSKLRIMCCSKQKYLLRASLIWCIVYMS